jgi:hypothetical protein
MQAETDEYPEGSERARHLGFRTTLVVPLIRAGEAIGAISIRRTEVRPFSDQQIPTQVQSVRAQPTPRPGRAVYAVAQSVAHKLSLGGKAPERRVFVIWYQLPNR